MTTTYHEIAARAGVSTATVSHVFRGTRPVRAATRAKVLDAAEELGYTPNDLAASLRRQSTRTVAFITTELTNPFYGDVALAAEGLLRERGYMMVICNSLNEVETEHAYLTEMLRRRVDGLVLTSVQVDSPTASLLAKLDVPAVLVNRRFEDDTHPYVGVDNFAAMRAVVDHLVSLGHRRIAHVGGFPHSSASRDRLVGYQRALSDHGLSAGDDLYVEGRYDVESGAHALDRFMQLPPAQRPTAVAAANDLCALGIVVRSADHGLRVPGDLSVTGFDDVAVAELGPVGLTTIRQPRKDLGRCAAEMLLKLISGEQLRESTAILPFELVVRGSTGPPDRVPASGS